MRNSLVQPSLSRDFFLLTGIILFTLALAAVWVAWSTYDEQTRHIVSELHIEADRIDRTLEREITNTGYLLNAIGHQLMVLKPDDTQRIARILQNYHASSRVFAVWSWADASYNLLVSSNKGILEKPISIADRDYVHKAASDPWQFHIGSPIEGRVSDRWVIPVSIGVTDETGKYLGSLTASLDIQSITDEISHLVKREGVSFAIISKKLAKLTEVSDTPNFVEMHFPKNVLESLDMHQPSGLVSSARLLPMKGMYTYYQLSSRFPYILLLGYDGKLSRVALEKELYPRLIQILTLALFLLLFLWIVRLRVIKPVVQLTDIAAGLTRGVPYVHEYRSAPVEIDALAVQIGHVSQYIEERLRLEDELREKLETALKKANEPPDTLS